MKRIIVDMMGGDRGVSETVKGVALAVEELSCELVLVGDRVAIEQAARETGVSLEGLEIVHASEVITMEDDPLSATREKRESSMSVGLRMLADGAGDAFVSTGNTGALFTGASLLVRKIRGVRRAAIAAILPMQPPVLLLDSGANLDVTAEYLEQFAVMGSIYMRTVMGVENPRVGLLNNGEEPHKGTPLQQKTYVRLTENPDVNFVGNVEGNRVMHDTCDVIVADGYTGNIFLKTMEGMGKLMLGTMRDLFGASLKTKMAYLMVKGGLSGVKKSFDAGECGGAPILGIKRPVIKAHGSSDAKAFKNAIRQALESAKTDLSGVLLEGMERLAARKKAMKAESSAEE